MKQKGFRLNIKPDFTQRKLFSMYIPFLGKMMNFTVFMTFQQLYHSKCCKHSLCWSQRMFPMISQWLCLWLIAPPLGSPTYLHGSKWHHHFGWAGPSVHESYMIFFSCKHLSLKHSLTRNYSSESYFLFKSISFEIYAWNELPNTKMWLARLHNNSNEVSHSNIKSLKVTANNIL